MEKRAELSGTQRKSANFKSDVDGEALLTLPRRKQTENRNIFLSWNSARGSRWMLKCDWIGFHPSPLTLAGTFSLYSHAYLMMSLNEIEKYTTTGSEEFNLELKTARIHQINVFLFSIWGKMSGEEEASSSSSFGSAWKKEKRMKKCFCGARSSESHIVESELNNWASSWCFFHAIVGGFCLAASVCGEIEMEVEAE